MPEPYDVEELICMAQGHGLFSEPDMEVGDLQMALRLVWAEVPEAVRPALYARIKDMIAFEEAEPPPEDITLTPKPSDGSGSVRG